MLHFSFVLVYELCTTAIALSFTTNATQFSSLCFLGIEVGATQQVQGFVGCCMV